MIEFATQKDIPLLKEVWHACFDDINPYIDSHYQYGRNCMRTLVNREVNGVISSMLDMVDVSLKFGQNQHKAFYIYAASTLPMYQGKGLMHQLIERSCAIAQQEGMVASLLIPQTQSLVDFYKKQQYTVPIMIGEQTLTLKPDSKLMISELSELEFIDMKMNYENTHQKCVLHNSALLALIYRQTLISGGKIVKILNNTGQSYAICYKIKSQVLIQEHSLCQQNLIDGIAAICQYMNVSSAQIRMAGQDRLYGLARVLGEHPFNWNGVYMNTMLD